MQKFLSMLFSRRALAIVGVVMLALLVWFIGPLVAFDTLHPLASVGSRLSGPTVAQKPSAMTVKAKSPSTPEPWGRPRATVTGRSTCCGRWKTRAGSGYSATTMVPQG